MCHHHALQTTRFFIHDNFKSLISHQIDCSERKIELGDEASKHFVSH